MNILSISVGVHFVGDQLTTLTSGDHKNSGYACTRDDDDDRK